jgi:hypothetical protein
MNWLQDVLNFILQTLLSEIVVVAAGVLFAMLIRNLWDKWRYGGWQVDIRQHGEQILSREISPAKMKQIFDEPTDLAIFVKGVTSPYAWLNCDPLEEGKRLGLLQIDKDARRLTIDLDKNPPRESYAGVREIPAARYSGEQTQAPQQPPHAIQSHSEDAQS